MTVTPATKSCHHCGGEILAAAVKCKHCKTSLDQAAPPTPPPASPSVTARAAEPMSAPATPPAPVVQAAGGPGRSSSITNQCPECGRYNTSRATKCIGCGAPLGKKRTRQNSKSGRLAVLVLFTVIGAAAVLALVFVFMASSDSNSSAAVATTPPPSKTQAEIERAQRKHKLNELHEILDGNPKSQDCFTLKTEGHVPEELCEGLVATIHKGRTSHQARRELRSLLKNRGYFRLRGYIVASDGPNTYEIYRNGHRLHAVLETNLTSYTTRGRFSLWAIKAGTRQVETKHGFTQTWDVFREDAFGSVVQRVFDAPAGQNTSEAAKMALKALLTISFWNEGEM